MAGTENIETKVEALEGVSVSVLMDYLTDREPRKSLIEKAKVAVGTFGAIQRRRSAENQRDALALMMQREGSARPLRHLNSGRSGGEPSS